MPESGELSRHDEGMAGLAVVTKLDRLARSARDARDLADELTAKQQAHLVGLHEKGEHTSAELAELFSVGRATVYRTVERSRKHQNSQPKGSP